VDLAAREVWTDSDERFPYDGLVVASGSHAVAPIGWPNGAPGLHVLHRLSDAWTLRHDLRDADRVAVVGGGLTGCETAAAVRALARRCVLIDANPQVMTHAIGEYVGGLVTEELRREGVDLRLGRRVTEIDRSRRNWRLVLDDGSRVDADVVVMTTGERPDTGWLESAGGLDLSDGVLCDESLRMIGASGVVAAGAVARWPNPRTGGRPIRCGQWLSALEQGKAAASTLMAGDGRVPPVTLLPRFWSEQFGLRIQAAGELPADAEMQVSPLGRGRGRHREVARSGVLVSYSRDDRLVGLVAVNAPRPFNAVTRSMLVSPEPMSWNEEAPVRRFLSAVN
jgi:NADPH-dependent 2,4-dienoyl-CoA reductase/sulfur reductase-like enzyme